MIRQNNNNNGLDFDDIYLAGYLLLKGATIRLWKHDDDEARVFFSVENNTRNCKGLDAFRGCRTQVSVRNYSTMLRQLRRHMLAYAHGVPCKIKDGDFLITDENFEISYKFAKKKKEEHNVESNQDESRHSEPESLC